MVTVAMLVLLLTGTLAGCAVSSDDDSRDEQTSAAEPTSSPTSESSTPSATASPSASTSASPSQTPAPAATPRAALLDAAELPQLNETSPWTQGRTGPAGAKPFGLCQKFDLLSIGAQTVVQRDFTSHGDSAAQQVAEFPDRKNALRARTVLEAWHRDCAQRISGNKVRVGPISEVPLSTGAGWWYLASFRRQGTGHFHSLGVVLSGSRMTLVRMEHDGQDHDYDAGEDPTELAVRAAAAKLG